MAASSDLLLLLLCLLDSGADLLLQPLPLLYLRSPMRDGLLTEAMEIRQLVANR